MKKKIIVALIAAILFSSAFVAYAGTGACGYSICKCTRFVLNRSPLSNGATCTCGHSRTIHK